MEKLKPYTAAKVGEMNRPIWKAFLATTPCKADPHIPAAPKWLHVGIIWGLYELVICGSTSSQSDLIDKTWALGALDTPRWF